MMLILSLSSLGCERKKTTSPSVSNLDKRHFVCQRQQVNRQAIRDNCLTKPQFSRAFHNPQINTSTEELQNTQNELVRPTTSNVPIIQAITIKQTIKLIHCLLLH